MTDPSPEKPTRRPRYRGTHPQQFHEKYKEHQPERYADDVVSIDRFGESAPGDAVMKALGITPEHVVERAVALLGR